MASKRALIVDDSKSARVILSRMLEKYDIQVDLAESAEQAIDYLQNHRPDAIFMDHLMPGMDGLQALQAIKGNPQTAPIPIMMYTSQEGELYLDQARALGAMGVMPKQVRPVDVSKVLYELHLLPERGALDAAPVAPAEAPVERPFVPAPPPALATAAATPDWVRRIEAALKDQSVDLRRFMVASMDGLATRIAGDVRSAPAPARAAPEPPIPVLSLPAKPRFPWGPVAAIAACLAAAFCALWLAGRGELARSHADLAALSAATAELTQSREELSNTVKNLSSALAQLPQSFGPPPLRTEFVPYGEGPFERGRVEALRELSTKLEAQGFRGLIRVSNSVGQFCLSGSAASGYALANPSLPASRCDLIGNPAADSASGQRESPAFAALVGSVRQRTAGAITVAIDAATNPRLAAAYPARSDTLSAAEWNRAASANNRVDFSIEPAAP